VLARSLAHGEESEDAAPDCWARVLRYTPQMTAEVMSHITESEFCWRGPQVHKPGAAELTRHGV